MTIDELIEMLNSEDCKVATSICLMRYRERDCWKCILKEYTKTVHNKAIDDFAEKLKRENKETIPTYSGYCRMSFDEVVDEIAEQLKADGENGKKKYIELS